VKLSQYILEASAKQYKDDFASHPLFAVLAQGKVQRTAYLAYLRETYHLIRHTTSVMARAASHLPDEMRSLRGWLIEQALDEHNHDLLCLNDIEALGMQPHAFVQSVPKSGAWGLITQSYYLAEHDPISLLAFLLTTEGIGSAYGTQYADLLTSHLYGYKSNQVTFLRAHGGFDVKHVEDVSNFMDELEADSRTRDSILAVRRFSISYYAQLLHDALEENALETRLA